MLNISSELKCCFFQVCPLALPRWCRWVPGAPVVGITVPVVAHALSLLSPPFIQAPTLLPTSRAFLGHFQSGLRYFQGSSRVAAPTCPVLKPYSLPPFFKPLFAKFAKYNRLFGIFKGVLTFLGYSNTGTGRVMLRRTNGFNTQEKLRFLNPPRYVSW